MRIHDDRYIRDQRRFEVAMRFIQHEARTQTIRVWTGLTDDRIRKLYRSYMQASRGLEPAPVRHRGKSPQQPSFFTRSTRARHESALLASLCSLVGALSGVVPGPARGELLCHAYESYRKLVRAPLISFEHTVFLVSALGRGDELVLGACRDCSALLVSDRWSLRAQRCVVCAGESAQLPLQ